MLALKLRHAAYAVLSLALWTSEVKAGANEALMLANCQAPNDANFKSSYVGYYSNSGDSVPSAYAKVSTPSGQTVWWEGGTPVSVTFSDGNTFSVSIPTRIIIENAYVGNAKNNFGFFSCFRQTHQNAFTAPDGAICSGIYICNHNAPPTSSIDVKLTFGVDQVIIPGDVNVYDLFHTVWDRRDATSCRQNAAPIPGTDCSISYDCYGATAWLETNGMASTLNGPVSKAVKYTTSENVKVCDGISETTHKCNDWIVEKQITSFIMKSGRVDVTNESPIGSDIPNSYAGWMTYDISCPSTGKNCAGCKAVSAFLGGGAAAGTSTLNPEVAGAFQAANVFTTVICALAGC